jgi:hypothetical protein
VRQLFAALGTTTNPDAIPVLVWLLARGDMRAYGSMIVERLSQPQVIPRLPLGELASILATGRPDHRLETVGLVAGILGYRGKEMAPTVRSRAMELLTASLNDGNVDVRVAAAQGLGTAQATPAVSFLLSTLDRPGLSTYEASVVINALASIGDPAALPSLERWASSSRPIELRESAVRGYLAIAKPPDPAREARRLLWEQPDTLVEASVLAQGRTALPLAWQALATGSSSERRAAAALLGWVRDRRSIQPILAALAQSPGALTKEQLLFDLNTILLTEGGPPEDDQRNALAAEHLRWLYDQLARERIDSDIRSAVLACRTIGVHPQRVVSPFSIELSSTTPGDGRGQASRPVVATAQRLESPQAFQESMKKDGCGVAFHAITAADGVARVATTLYLPRGRIANQVWISLYRNEGDKWVSLQARSHPVLHRMLNEPNLLPTVNRNYGMDDPLKILRLDLTMERIRVDLKASEYLRSENRGIPGHIRELDASYVPLLERYRISESPAVRYTAELESLKLTDRPDFDVWIDALTRQGGTQFRAMAQEVLATYAERAFERNKGVLAGTERAELIAAAGRPEPVDAALLPRPLPQAESIRQVQRSGRFGLISVVVGSGPRAQSGYSMLFDRRGDRWIFLCVVRGWIS